jgi:hypothetical protein
MNLTYRKIGMLLMIAAIYTTMLVLLWRWHDSMAWLSAVLGLCVGFTTGILTAPYPGEEGMFKEYSKIASGFLTGFLVSKVDQVFNLVMDEKRGPLILNEFFVRRLMIGICGFMIAMTGAFLARRYFNESVARPKSSSATGEVPPSAASSSSA